MVVAFNTPMNISLEILLKIKQKSIKEFELQAREFAVHLMQDNKLYTIFRIAKELQELYCDIEYIEDFFISTKNPFYIFKFAREIKSSNIVKLQQAIIDIQNYNYIAKFACFVAGADTELLEKIIIKSNNAKAAYIYLKFGKHPNIQNLKHIFLKSKKPRYLYALAQNINDPDDIALIQDLIIASHSNMYVRLFAAHILGANINKLEDRILKTKNIQEIKKFAKTVGSERLNKLVILM